MAIALSKLAVLLSEPPEVAIGSLIEKTYLSDQGLAHRSEIVSLLRDTHKTVAAAQAARSPEYFEITGPQPTAGFESLALELERRGYFSPVGLAARADDRRQKASDINS